MAILPKIYLTPYMPVHPCQNGCFRSLWISSLSQTKSAFWRAKAYQKALSRNFSLDEKMDGGGEKRLELFTVL